MHRGAEENVVIFLLSLRLLKVPLFQERIAQEVVACADRNYIDVRQQDCRYLVQEGHESEMPGKNLPDMCVLTASATSAS